MEIVKPDATTAQELTRPGSGDQSSRARQGEAIQENAKGKEAAESSVSAETVEISAQARLRAEHAQTLASLREAYDALPDLREDVLADVKARLDEGHYETDEVRAALIDILGPVAIKLTR